jgi:AcrR family transcriptional regulator
MTATLRLVAERGIAGTSVVDIEAEVGLAAGRGGFYRHFPSKEDALRAALAAEIERLRERQRSPNTGVTVADELAAGLAWLGELRPVITIVLRDGAAVPETVRALRRLMAGGATTAGLTLVADSATAAGRDPVASAVVVTMASLGFHLAETFLGTSIEGIDAARFVATMTEMVG